MAQWLRFYFTDQIVYDDKAAVRFLTAETAPLLGKLVQALESLPRLDEASIEQVFQQLLAETGLKLGAIAQPARVALTGDTVSPGIHQIMAILGRERVLSRLSQAMAWTASHAH
jgi:glutamyl-tRNA synthetase